MTPTQSAFYQLGVALGIGLLIGVERGWAERGEEEGTRVAGVRTFALIGLSGGAAALVYQPVGLYLTALGLVALAALFATGHAVHARIHPEQLGITVPVAGLLTFILGALAGSGRTAPAAAAAVVAALLLSSKSALHRWLGGLSKQELSAGVQLALLSVVVLPLLPDQGYGPWQTLNPYRIWWMVVLIAAISFVGYFAVNEIGARRGSVLTGAVGGLASSTALTLHFARLVRERTGLAPVLSTGVLLACGTMFPRMLAILSVAATGLVAKAIAPLALMALAIYAAALRQWWISGDHQPDSVPTLENPLELRSALGFGALLAVIMVTAKAVEVWLGGAGVLALAAASGIADVDAITLALAGMTGFGLDPRIAVAGIVVAAAVNNLVKTAVAGAIGGRALGLSVGLPLVASAILGPLAVWLLLW